MFKLQNFLKRYVWDPETTPYFVKVSNLSRSQADNELFFFALMAAILFGMGTFTSITGQQVLPLSFSLQFSFLAFRKKWSWLTSC